MAQVGIDGGGGSSFVRPKHATYDVVVVGAGAGGITASVSSAVFGARTLLVERRAVTGGDCTWSGCVPSKALLRCAKAAKEVRNAEAFGVSRGAAGPVTIDYGAVRAHIASAQRAIYEADDSPSALGAKGVEVLTSTSATFVSATRLLLRSARIAPPDGTTSVEVEVEVEARRVVVCVGAEPAAPLIEGLDTYLTSDTVWAMERLPAALVVLGGGPIGCELAQAFARLGSKVTLVGRVLPREPGDASAIVERALVDDGVVVVKRHAARFERTTDGTKATIAFAQQGAGGGGGGGESLTVACDEVIVTAGRSAARALADLGIDRAGVKLTANSRGGVGGIVVDAHLRTTAKTVFAVGDCIGGLQFTHLAVHQGGIAAWNACMPAALWLRGPSDESVPRCTFTDPEVASVGLSAVTAMKRHPDARETRAPMHAFDRAVCDGSTQGYVAIVHRGDRGRVLGATAVGHGAGELVAELALARKKKLTMADLATTMHPYPSMAFGLQVAAGGSYYKYVAKAAKGTAVALARTLGCTPKLRGAVPSSGDGRGAE